MHPEPEYTLVQASFEQDCCNSSTKYYSYVTQL